MHTFAALTKSRLKSNSILGNLQCIDFATQHNKTINFCGEEAYVAATHTEIFLVAIWPSYISRESKTTRNVLWSRASVCLSVCLCDCPRPHANTIARTRM